MELRWEKKSQKMPKLEGVKMRIPIVSDLLDRAQGIERQPESFLPSHNINFSGSPGADYPESFYRNQTDIRKVNSQKDMIDWVESALLSRRCKDAFKSLIANLYDDNVILSYHVDELHTEIRLLKAKIYLRTFVITNSYKSDVYNPVWALIMNEVFYQFELRLTRTISVDRERIAQGKTQQVYEIRQGAIKEPPLQR